MGRAEEWPEEWHGGSDSGTADTRRGNGARVAAQTRLEGMAALAGLPSGIRPARQQQESDEASRPSPAVQVSDRSAEARTVRLSRATRSQAVAGVRAQVVRHRLRWHSTLWVRTTRNSVPRAVAAPPLAAPAQNAQTRKKRGRQRGPKARLASLLLLVLPRSL